MEIVIRKTLYPSDNRGADTRFLSVDQFVEMPAGGPSEGEGVLWLDFYGVLSASLISHLVTVWGLHALAIHAASDSSASTRLQEYSTHISLGLRVITGDTGSMTAAARISILMGQGFLMTFHEKEEPVLASVQERIADRLPRSSGAAYLMYEMLDGLMEGYFEAIEGISELIDDLDARLTERDDAKSLARLQEEILGIKRRLLVLHRALTPLRDSLQSIRHTDGGLINDTDRAYLRHAADQVLSILDNIASDREILAGASEILMSAATKHMNEVMTFLTVFTAFFIPINFIAGFYGMNLIMPEFGMKGAYPVVIAVMATIVASMFLWFRRRGWL